MTSENMAGVDSGETDFAAIQAAENEALDAREDDDSISVVDAVGSLAAFDFSQEALALCEKLAEKSGVVLPEKRVGGMPLQLGLCRGRGIVQLAAAAWAENAPPSEFYRLSSANQWVRAGAESENENIPNRANEARAVIEDDRQKAVLAVQKERGKNFAGLGVPKNGKWPKQVVRPSSFSDAWRIMSSVLNVNSHRLYFGVVEFREDGLLVGTNGDLMAVFSSAVVVPGVYSADGVDRSGDSEHELPDWESVIPEVKRICKPAFSYLASPTNIPTLESNASAVGLQVGEFRLAFSLEVYARLWLFFTRACQVAPQAAAYSTSGAVVFWTPFACVVAMPLREAPEDSDTMALNWSVVGPPKTADFSPIPRLWGTRMAAERACWQSGAMAEWRERKNTGERAENTQESMHRTAREETDMTDGERTARRLAERAGISIPDSRGISEIDVLHEDDSVSVSAYSESMDAEVYLTPSAEWNDDAQFAKDFTAEYESLESERVEAEAPPETEDDSSSADDGIPPSPVSAAPEKTAKAKKPRKAKKAAAKKPKKKKAANKKAANKGGGR